MIGNTYVPLCDVKDCHQLITGIPTVLRLRSGENVLQVRIDLCEVHELILKAPVADGT